MYECRHCDITMNSQSQWDQHIQGTKHAKQVKKDSLTKSLTSNGDFSAAILQPSGHYGCKYCKDFVCTGIVPMRQHLAGSKHKKNALLFQSHSASDSRFLVTQTRQYTPELTGHNMRDIGPVRLKDSVCEVENKPSVANPTRRQTLSPLTTEESIIEALQHQVPCGFTYDDNFPSLTTERKIRALCHHFGFIASNEKVPSLTKIMAHF